MRARPGSRSSLASGPLLLLAACAPVAVSAQVGYSRLHVDGELALANSAASGGSQDLGSAFGLGDERGSPFARVVADFGVPVLGVSGFWLHEAGAGVLADSFGGLPPSTPVTTDLDLGSFQVMALAEFACGPVVVAPGLLVDVFAIDFRASTSPGNAEVIDEIVAVPLPGLRVSGSPVPGCDLALTGGWLDARSLLDSDVRFLDVEAAVTWRLAGGIDVQGGYRWLEADAAADSATDSVRIDLQVRGWFIDAGVRF
ncbi:MAG: hypothetical protein WAT39_17960 [Planctomycetota bacterium]